MTDEQKISIEDERRRFFRIEDLVHLTFRIIDDTELAYKTDLLEKGLVEQFMITSSLAAVTADMSATLRKIEVNDPDVANYLKSLDQKIDMIGRAFMVDEVNTHDNKASAVNLSASGIAFHHENEIPLGTNLEIKMLLMPSNAGVLTYGKVIGNEPAEEANVTDIQVRVDFTHLREEDRDLLIRHVIRKQGDMLRERRVARENSDIS
ncbi:MAG: PilZ domain-containing protein [Gammaproteobacteria bacterium]|nr:PilZ domain-containing protein [Gammaproteobacteria bacterium]NNJ91056.1 PilZ domain-containing protein [Gammaproteobacteria bacterium]